MFQGISEKFVSGAIRAGYIEPNKKDEYLYGMNMLLNVSLNIVSMIIIGIITGRLWECIVFCIVYKILRRYTGGFHFESALYCYISSCIMYLIVIAMIDCIPFKVCEVSAMTAISSVILWFLSPVEAVHKPLDDCEKRVFRKRARINSALTLAAYAVCLFISSAIAEVISLGIIWAAVFAVAGEIKITVYKEKRVL